MTTTGGCQAQGRRAGPCAPPNRQQPSQPSRERAALIHESHEEVTRDPITLTRRHRQRDATASCTAQDRVQCSFRQFQSDGYRLQTWTLSVLTGASGGPLVYSVMYTGLRCDH